MSQIDPTATLVARFRGVRYLIRQRTFGLDLACERIGPSLTPLLTSLAAAFKTAFERLSGSNVFGLMPDPSFFTFARLSLPPSFGCLDDAIGHEAKLN